MILVRRSLTGVYSILWAKGHNKVVHISPLGRHGDSLAFRGSLGAIWYFDARRSHTKFQPPRSPFKLVPLLG